FTPLDLSQAGGTLDPTKFAAYGSLLDSFAADADYEMRTFDTHYRIQRSIALPTPQPPPPYPVIFESDDTRDGLWEGIATDMFLNRHVPEGVPLSQATVACGQGSTEDPFVCVENTFHDNYATWMADHPGMLEIVQHGTFHTEHNHDLSEAQQLDIINKGLQHMSGWNLPNGRPFTYAAPFSEVNDDTISVLEQLGYHTVVQNAGLCPFSFPLDRFCNSISLCERDTNGDRVEGPDCVLRSAADLIADVNAQRPNRPAAFITYHMQDMTFANGQLNGTKATAFQAILNAFRAQEVAGNFDLTTYDGYYNSHSTPIVDLIFGDGFE
ncbi:MAG: hypothetical protein ACREQQ_04490, partial [Candidatus Binatia bacterium]